MSHVWVWVMAGVLGGALGRAWRGGAASTLASDVVGGLLGALACGLIAHRVGGLGPEALMGHLVVGLAGALLLLSGVRVVAWLLPGVAVTGGAGPRVLDLEAGLRRLGELQRRLLHGVLARTPVARDPNEVFDAESTLGDRVADRVARFGGSWTFIGIFGVIILGWMALNEESASPFDPYPFILLNLVLSCLAALQAPVIMMSQNRQEAKDRVRSEHDYKVNLKAELEIRHLHEKMDHLLKQQAQRLLEIQQIQIELLEEVLKKSSPPNPSPPTPNEPNAAS